MALAALFDRVVARLQSQRWSRTVADMNGNPVDTGLDRFVQELAAALQDSKPIRLNRPLELIWEGDGPALKIISSNSSQGVQVKNADNQQSTLGIGQLSTGIIANEFVPDPNYYIDPAKNHEHQSNTGIRLQTAQTVVADNMVTRELAKRVDCGFGGCGGGNGDPTKWPGGNDTIVAYGGMGRFFTGLRQAATRNGGLSDSPTGTVSANIGCGDKIYFVTDPHSTTPTTTTPSCESAAIPGSLNWAMVDNGTGCPLAEGSNGSGASKLMYNPSKDWWIAEILGDATSFLPGIGWITMQCLAGGWEAKIYPNGRGPGTANEATSFSVASVSNAATPPDVLLAFTGTYSGAECNSSSNMTLTVTD